MTQIVDLLSSVNNLFNKELLLPSFLPATLFSLIIILTFSVVVGIESFLDYIDSWSVTQIAINVALTVIYLLLFSYLLNSFRSFFIKLWSGQIDFLSLGKYRQRKRFLRYREQANTIPYWENFLSDFEKEAKKKWNGSKKKATKKQVDKIIENLEKSKDKEGLQTIKDDILKALDQRSGESLIKVYVKFKTIITDLAEQEDIKIKTDAYILDRHFGLQATLKATTLGNIIDSYNIYPSKRYNIESEIFWARLQSVIEEDYLKIIQEPKILLDLFITMASLLVIYGFTLLVVGPFLWYNPFLWISLSVISFLIGYFFYRLSIEAALQLGEYIRSSFDLFRINLIDKLQFQRPSNFIEEKAFWTSISQLVVYGDKITNPKIKVIPKQ